MFKFRQSAILRFNLLVIFAFTLAGVLIIGKAAVIMFVERDKWNAKKEESIKRNVPIEQRRGDIIADNGELIVSTLPKYRLKFDFKYYNPRNKNDEKKINSERDSIWNKHLHELCVGMNNILPGTSVNELKERFRYGLKNRKGGYEPYRGSISYLQYKEIQKLPIINLGKKYSGCYTEELIERKNMIGNAGNSTFGVARITEIDGKRVEETNGLEKKYNEYLRGETGYGTRSTIGGKRILREDKQPKDGYDIQTTLDTEMMNICHTALERELKAKTLAAGWAILMETKTGDIKAVVNLSPRKIKVRNGVKYVDEYIDTIGNSMPLQRSHAFCERYQPGSIFKTVALTAILADGKLTTKDSVKSYESRVKSFSGHVVHDEMYRDNGTGKYSMSDAMMYSSNISLVQFIKDAYGDNPKEYSNTLVRFGLEQNYNLIDKEATPYIKKPGNADWDGYSLNSMAMGYAIEMTAINMVAFYNTIANGGRQMQPRLVKAVLNNGKVVKEFPTRVLDEQLFTKEVADTMTNMLVNVVNGKTIDQTENRRWRMGINEGRDGTGKQAYSEMMTIAGKTGTAISAKNKKDKLMSFCGFFPAEAPEYTLIVQIMYEYDLDPRPDSTKVRKGYGGGSTSAIVFKEIAENIMVNKIERPVQRGEKELPITPSIKKGNLEEAYLLLNSIGALDSIPQIEKGKEWGEIKYTKDGKHKVSTTEFGKVPDVKGMGAKEAVYLLGRHNFNVVIDGYGIVKMQMMGEDENTIILKLGQ